MRLLRIDQDGQFTLVEIVSNANVPPYAILSHTWGADGDEVTYKDMVDGIGQTKVGYQKIRFCGQQAAKDGVQFFWIDTCCIDKSSSQELSEAINSMFQWYRDAVQCYVYLADVSSNEFHSNRSCFKESRWFTRGWTLQELLAPKAVQFFSIDGELLGDRTSLVQDISTVTNISAQALSGWPLSQFSVSERMSWAQDRETKRVEDNAYCLMGIFGVHMPLLYGEGRHGAFRRLRKEMASSDLTDAIKWLASPDYSKTYHEALHELEKSTAQWIFNHPHFFQWFDASNSNMTLGRLRWIYGTPGGGKTTLAASVISRLSSQRMTSNSSSDVFYYFFRHEDASASLPISAFRSIACQLLHRYKSNPALVTLVLSIMENGRESIGSQSSTMFDVLEVLQGALKMLRSTYIILDGLDECANVGSLIKNIQRLLEIPTIRILLFSRPNIYDLLQVIPEEDRLNFGQNGVNDDIEIYLTRNIEKLAQENRLLPKADLQEYVKHLALGANKMFLWAKLMIYYLRSPALTRSMIDQLIWSIILPEGLGTMYERIFTIMSRSSKPQQHLATRILSWILYNRQTLSVESLQIVVAPISELGHEIGESWPDFSNLVPVITCGLVVPQGPNTSSGFSLVHLSAWEYLKMWRPSSPELSDTDLLRPTEATSNLELAKTCLQLLLHRGLRGKPPTGLKQLEKDPPMIAYAAKYWIDHLASSHAADANSIWDHGRFSKTLKDVLGVVSAFLASTNAVAAFFEVFYRDRSFSPGCRMSSALEGHLRALCHWIQWIQEFDTLGPAVAASRQVLSKLLTFCNEMKDFNNLWASKLSLDPLLIWSDALVFNSSRFLPSSDYSSRSSYVPSSHNTANHSSRSLCHISTTSKDTNVLGVLSIWPSKTYESFWQELDPYAAYSQVETFCTDWIARYELWSTEHANKLLLEITIPMDTSEVVLQMKQSFRHESDASWKTSFPLSISSDGLYLCILRTLYRLQLPSSRTVSTWKSIVLPLDTVPSTQDKWDGRLRQFDPENIHIKPLPVSLRLLHRDWYTYCTIFSPDGRFLLFADHQVPFKRNLIMFGNINDIDAGLKAISSTLLYRPRSELRFVEFHPTLQIVVFLCGELYIWKFDTYGKAPPTWVDYLRKLSHSEPPSRLEVQDDLLGGSASGSRSKITGLCFSLCGRYISVALDHKSIIVSLADAHLFVQPNRLLPDPETACKPEATQVIRSGVMSIDSILASESSHATPTFGNSLEHNRLQQGLVLNLSSSTNLSARSCEIIGGNVIEQTAHILELPSSVTPTKVITKTHVEDASNPEKLSIIFNKSLEQGYSMNDDCKEIFPAIVSIPRPNIALVQHSRPWDMKPSSGVQYLSNEGSTEFEAIDEPSKKRRIGN